MLFDQIFSWISSGDYRTQNHVQMVSRDRVILGTSIGGVRKENQDRVITVTYHAQNPQNCFFVTIVCDGMGGLRDGSECANIAVAAFVDSLLTTNKTESIVKLKEAVLSANKEVLNRYEEEGGTTLSAVYYSGSGKWFSVNVGDTRIYRTKEISKRLIVLEQITPDDTIQAELKKLEVFSTRTDIGENFSNSLAQYIGMSGTLDPHIHSLTDFMVGDKLLIASDGLYVIGDEIMTRLTRASSNDLELARHMLTVAQWCGGEDNASISIVNPCGESAIFRNVDSQEHVELFSPFSQISYLIVDNTRHDRVSTKMSVANKASVEHQYDARRSRKAKERNEDKRRKSKAEPSGQKSLPIDESNIDIYRTDGKQSQRIKNQQNATSPNNLGEAAVEDEKSKKGRVGVHIVVIRDSEDGH